MSLSRFLITGDPLDIGAVVRLVEGDEPGLYGAAVTFVGVVRREHLGHRVVRLEYEAYESLAVKALQAIGREALGHWPGSRLAIVHRVGSLVPGETSIIIAAAAPHRADAFRACRYAIERVKQIVPIWKHEYVEGGEHWVEGATADPADEAARADAFKRACA